jgi:aminomethyltransferase
MKKTPFYDVHIGAGAKMVDFGGYAMPVQYTGIIDEHNRVRNSVGVFDVSHMGEIEVRGENAMRFVQYVTLNDVTNIEAGRAQYSAMTDENGGLIDDLLVYHLGSSYMLVVNAANKEKDYAWIEKQAASFEGISINDISDQTALIAVQGPKSRDVLQRLLDIDLSGIKYYHFERGTLKGTEMIISRTGYTGELGFELYYNAADADNPAVWNAIMEAGKSENIGPAGLGSRDTLRLEMGMLLYGNDMTEQNNPLEAGLGWITKFDKGDFVGKEALLKIKSNGTKRKLTGFKIVDESMARRAIPRHGFPITLNGKEIGEVTSGTLSPTLKISIAMGYIDREYAEEGREVTIAVRNQKVPFTVTKPPFLRR